MNIAQDKTHPVTFFFTDTATTEIYTDSQIHATMNAIANLNLAPTET